MDDEATATANAEKPGRLRSARTASSASVTIPAKGDIDMRDSDILAVKLHNSTLPETDRESRSVCLSGPKFLPKST